MTVDFNSIKEIVETLPIGLYANRRIPCEMDTMAETSYYIPQEDKIIISYPIIAEGLKNVELSEDYTEETAIRSMVYHELSHAILTTNDVDCMKHISSCVPFDVFNIFEDERIETILKNYYLDVNFKKQVLAINGGKISKPTNDISAFYNIVRFRNGKPDLVAEVEDLIEKYKSLDRNTTLWAQNDKGVSFYDYLWDLKLFWNKVQCKWRGNNPNAQQQISDFMSEASSDSNGNMAEGDGVSENEGQNGEGNGDDTENANENDNASEVNGNTPDKKGDTPNGKAKKAGQISNEEARAIFNKSLDVVDTKVYDALNNIICQFNKKNNSGSGFNSYSGVFNPRAVIRDDYRYFERKCSVNGNNRFGSLHLNLFLDNSGSYEYNVLATNRIIQALIDIEKQNSNFNFDVYFVADYHRKAKTVREKYVAAEGGTRLVPQVGEFVKDGQKPNTYNYNIVLFDGSCNCGHLFKFFNLDNCTIISDSSNERNIKSYAPKARAIFENDKYPEKLAENIIKVLQGAFR